MKIGAWLLTVGLALAGFDAGVANAFGGHKGHHGLHDGHGRHHLRHHGYRRFGSYTCHRYRGYRY